MTGPSLTALGAILALMSGVWAWSVRVRNASIIDGWWGLGFVFLAAIAVWQSPITTTRAVVVLALVSLWGARLSWHIVVRNHGAGEDPRYAAMRAGHGEAFWWRSLFTVFWLQAVLLWIIAWPLEVAITAQEPRELGAADMVGVALFALGFAFESVGDWQLARFKADPANKGRVLDRGLWRYTRHPNYFGDATLWWGLGCFGLATGAWWVLVSPALMTVLLVKVSGVALLEKGLSHSKPGYRDYVARTNAFLPWWPRA